MNTLKILVFTFCMVTLLHSTQRSQAQTNVSIVEIGPKQSSLDAADPDGASGGRVNGLAVDPQQPDIMFAASEWGGLFRSIDAGRRWDHVDSHVPAATWDVEVSPVNSNLVFATSFFDGRVEPRSGINVSQDAGVTWNKPATSTAPAVNCSDSLASVEPSAFGIAVNPDNPSNIVIGTNCGVAISNDSGTTWAHQDVTPASAGAGQVWDVVVHDGGIIDTCGTDGHRRSVDGGATWTGANILAQLPSAARCSIDVSPDESYVLFAIAGTSLWESLDGGTNWNNTYTYPGQQGRIPFVSVNDRAGTNYDIWIGDIRLFRAGCQTPAAPAQGGSPRCQTNNALWAGPFTRTAGGHDDMGAILFDPGQTVDACPQLMSSDGGVYFNTLAASPGCHSPAWEQPFRTPQAVWNFDMAGVTSAGVATEALYFGNQDTGTFGTTTGGAAMPAWINERCCDGFDVVGEASRVLSTVCCFSPPPATRLFISGPGMVGGPGEINQYPPGNMRSFEQLDSIVNFATDSYVVATTTGAYSTTDIGAAPVVWTQLGAATSPAPVCGIQVAGSGATRTVFAKSGGCNGDRAGRLWRHVGTGAGSSWSEIFRPGGGNGRFGVYSVDPDNPQRIIVSDIDFSGVPSMHLTEDGGANWTRLDHLEKLMSGRGTFLLNTQRGPTRFTGFNGYPQPTLVAFDPFDDNIILAAAADSGVFVSLNRGVSWRLLSDPETPHITGLPHIPRARYAHFDHDLPSAVRVYLGTQGRGQWTLKFDLGPVPDIEVPGPLEFGNVCRGEVGEATLNVCNTGPGTLIVDDILSDSTSFSITEPIGTGYPLSIASGACFPFQGVFDSSGQGSDTAILTIESNDLDEPFLEVAVNGDGTVPNIFSDTVTDFGTMSAWSSRKRPVSLCNDSECLLSVSGATSDCADFEVDPTSVPIEIAASSCHALSVEFTPTVPGPHECTLSVLSDDPDTPVLEKTLRAKTSPAFSIHTGVSNAKGHLKTTNDDGATLNLDFVYDRNANLAWDVRLGFTDLSGIGGSPDMDIVSVHGNAKYTFNPGNPVQLFLNGGAGAVHFDPGSTELGLNLGLGVKVPLSSRFDLEATYNYHNAITASPDLEFDQIQLGLLIHF